MDAGVVKQWSELANGVTVAGLLALVIIGGYLRWWVWGYQFRDMKTERDEYKRLFHQSIGVFTRVVAEQQQHTKASGDDATS